MFLSKKSLFLYCICSTDNKTRKKCLLSFIKYWSPRSAINPVFLLVFLSWLPVKGQIIKIMPMLSIQALGMTACGLVIKIFINLIKLFVYAARKCLKISTSIGSFLDTQNEDSCWVNQMKWAPQETYYREISYYHVYGICMCIN